MASQKALSAKHTRASLHRKNTYIMIVGISQGGTDQAVAQAKSGKMSVASCGGVTKQLKCTHFQMPLHYPRYTRADYEIMPEWKLDCLLVEYGLPLNGDVERKRKFAMGAFLWVL